MTGGEHQIADARPVLPIEDQPPAVFLGLQLGDLLPVVDLQQAGGLGLGQYPLRQRLGAEPTTQRVEQRGRVHGGEA